MEPTAKGFQNLGVDLTKHILKFFDYSEIMELFFVSRQFGQLQNDPGFQHQLLESQFGAPNSSHVGFREYYIALKKILKKIQQIYQVNSITNYNISKIQYLLYPLIRAQQKKYSKTEIDLRFLMVRSISALFHQSRLVFGGALYYHIQQFYMTIKDDELDTNIPLYKEVILGHNLLVADFDNKLGMGRDQRYVLVGDSVSSWTLVRWNENYLEAGTKREKYLDYFDTLVNPKSDCTTRGIRIRTDSRLVMSDERFDVSTPFFSYQIRFSDDGGSKEGAKLVSRKWVITDHQGNDEVVEGPGVIGYYPYMYENCLDFIYESCCGLKGMGGSMQGSFVFQDRKTKEHFEVIVNPFKLQYGPHVAYRLNKETLQVTEIL